jgi:hypothetical protein
MWPSGVTPTISCYGDKEQFDKETCGIFDTFVFSLRQAKRQFEQETCGPLGPIILWQYNLVKDEADEIVGYDPNTRTIVNVKMCPKLEKGLR